MLEGDARELVLADVHVVGVRGLVGERLDAVGIVSPVATTRKA
jgi:hypothetical protein